MNRKKEIPFNDVETNISKKESILASRTKTSASWGSPAVTSIGSSYCSDTSNTRETAIEISLNSTETGNFRCPNGGMWFCFTPNYDGIYTIYTSGTLDTYGELYQGDSSTPTNVTVGKIGSNNLKIETYFTANETYYIHVLAQPGNTGGFCIRVTNRGLAQSVNVTPRTII